MRRFLFTRHPALLALALAAGCDDPARPKPTADTTPPRVEVVSPTADTLYVTTAGVPPFRPVRGAATDTVGVARVTYQINAGSEVEVPITPGTSVAFTAYPRLDEGPNTLVFHAYDAAGNRGTSPPRKLTQDTQGPVVRLLAPQEGSTVDADTVRLRLTATDPAGVTYLRIRLSSGNALEFAMTGDTTVALEIVVALSAGENLIHVEAQDRFGIRQGHQFRVNRRGVAFASVAVGPAHACALTPQGAAYCWGETRYGRTGTGAQQFALGAPTPVSGGPSFREASAGDAHSCAVTPGGEAWCWGWNRHGQIGTGSRQQSEYPAPARVTGGIAFRAVTAGAEHTCGVSVEDVAYCWGSAEGGRLGTGTARDTAAPARVALELPLRSVGVGSGHACALTPEGRAYCWGQNRTGQLGTGTTSGSAVPVPVAGGLLFGAIAPALAHTCALTTDGRAYCWGNNFLGELGTGELQQGTTPTTSPTPVKTGLRFASIATGTRHSCALAEDGAAWCWGDNVEGQLGTGGTEGSAVPVRVAGGLAFRTVVARGARTCGVTTDSRLYCWGGRTRSPAPVPGQ